MSRGDTYFRVDASLCAAIPRVISRAHGFVPHTDVWLVLALHAYADALPEWQRTLVDDASGMTVLRVPYQPSSLLEVMGYARSRESGRDFSSEAWRMLRGAVRRLATASVRVPYSTIDARVGGGAGTRHLMYEGPLVRLIGTAVRERHVELAVAGGLARFYINVGRDAFSLRRELDEVSARVLVWLLRKHRGRMERADGRRVLVHNEFVDVDVGELAAELALCGGPRRRHDAVGDALALLDWNDVVALDRAESSRSAVRVELIGSVFHREER